MQPLIRFAEKGGMVLGVCNGFQILCESHLLPGVLLRNANQQFIGKNIYIKQENGQALKIPIAHGEGRFYANDQLLDEMESAGQVLWKYCDAEGNITAESNPNGSTRGIAGICNKERNVIGLMPHPERAVSESLGNTDGRKLFQQIFNGRNTFSQLRDNLQWQFLSNFIGYVQKVGIFISSFSLFSYRVKVRIVQPLPGRPVLKNRPAGIKARL